uniref:NAC domain-containing protein n=1 Tax=Leersia perrieri TaxID=77586 RepID=A0A0D9WGR5_9ORYZ
MAQTCLPPGFRFHPTDVELVAYYLKRKLMGKKPLVQAISDVDMYKFAPWDLPAQSCLQSRDLEWFFFCPRDKKYPKGSRTNRSTPNGYWKTSGKDRTIELNSRIVGSKKTLIFHEGKAPKGNRTDWVMYEYKMEDNELVSAGFSKDDYVLCKIFKKSGLGPRIGEQYGAPFNEAEWELADAETSMFPLLQTTNVETSAFPLLPSSEHSGLPPMSEAEAHAFEVNTNDLYNEITGLAELGVPNGDGISVSNPGVTEQHTSQPTYIGVPSNENYLNMDDLFAPDPTLSYAYAVPNNPYWKFPMDQSAYDSTTSAAFLSSPTMPSFADDLPAIANNDVSDTGDIVGFHMLAVVHN